MKDPLLQLLALRRLRLSEARNRLRKTEAELDEAREVPGRLVRFARDLQRYAAGHAAAPGVRSRISSHIAAARMKEENARIRLLDVSARCNGARRHVREHERRHEKLTELVKGLRAAQARTMADEDGP